MKNTIFIFVIFFQINLVSQTIYNDVSFRNKIFNLKLIKKEYISKKIFNKGIFIFGEATKNGLKTARDYRNLAVALSFLDESIYLVKYAIDKAFALNSDFMFDLYKYMKVAKPIRYKRDLKWFPSIEGKLLKLERENEY